MLMHKSIKVILIFVILIYLSILASAHPGGTDSLGCHTCRTNCEQWGIEYGFYHRHNPVRPCSGEQPVALPVSASVPSLTNQQTIVEKQSPVSKIISTYSPIKINDSSLFKVVSITDGDTINVEISGKIEKVRLLGIDSPETYKQKQCFGNEATAKMNKLVNGKFVRLEKDSRQPNRDRFGRLLRYVYLEDGTLVNEEMVKEGYAIAYRKYNSDKLKDFIKLEKQAKSQKLGLWSSCNMFSRMFYYISSGN